VTKAKAKAKAKQQMAQQQKKKSQLHANELICSAHMQTAIILA